MATSACQSLRGLSSTATTRRFVVTKPRKTAFSTASRSSQRHPVTTTRRPCIVARIPPRPFTPSTTIALRHSSSTTSTTPTDPSTPSPDALTWNRFFDLRRKRRFLNLGASVVTAVGTVGVFGPMIAAQDLDGWAAQVSGIDPIIVLGLTTFAVAAGGWLCGPSVGNLGFKAWAGRRGWERGIAEKEKSFYNRIKRYRADPSHSSPQNPIPDYYGEKIGSVKDYRRWLKDQRAFNLKKDKAFL